MLILSNFFMYKENHPPKTAFAWRITQSQVLPGLAISLLNEAFRRTRQTDQSQVIAWLLSQFESEK
jgi:hypothetical protein